MGVDGGTRRRPGPCRARPLRAKPTCRWTLGRSHADPTSARSAWNQFLRLNCDQTPAKRPQNARKQPNPDSAPTAESGSLSGLAGRNSVGEPLVRIQPGALSDLALLHPLRPRAQRRDTVQIPEGGVVVVSDDSVGLVGDDGTDQAALSAK